MIALITLRGPYETNDFAMSITEEELVFLKKLAEVASRSKSNSQPEISYSIIDDNTFEYLNNTYGELSSYYDYYNGISPEVFEYRIAFFDGWSNRPKW